MNLTKQLLTATGLLVAMIVIRPASADIDTPRIDQRQAQQAERIERGIESGALTQREQNRLENQHDRIERTENRVESDDILTRRERARLTHQQNKASRAITRKKHNLRRQ